MEKAVTANSHVDGECFDHSIHNKTTGASNRNRHTHSARICRLRDGLRAALNDIRIGATILCKKWSSAVMSKQKLRHNRIKRLSGVSDVRPVCSAKM